MIPISQAVGLTIACPNRHGPIQCKAPAVVKHASDRIDGRQPERAEPSIASVWYRAECSKCGKKLYRASEPVEVIQ